MDKANWRLLVFLKDGAAYGVDFVILCIALYAACIVARGLSRRALGGQPWWSRAALESGVVGSPPAPAAVESPATLPPSTLTDDVLVQIAALQQEGEESAGRTQELMQRIEGEPALHVRTKQEMDAYLGEAFGRWKKRATELQARSDFWQNKEKELCKRYEKLDKWKVREAQLLEKRKESTRREQAVETSIKVMRQGISELLERPAPPWQQTAVQQEPDDRGARAPSGEERLRKDAGARPAFADEADLVDELYRFLRTEQAPVPLATVETPLQQERADCARREDSERVLQIPRKKFNELAPCSQGPAAVAHEDRPGAHGSSSSECAAPQGEAHGGGDSVTYGHSEINMTDAFDEVAGDIHKFLLREQQPVPLSSVGLMFHKRVGSSPKGWLKKMIRKQPQRFELLCKGHSGREAVVARECRATFEDGSHETEKGHSQIMTADGAGAGPKRALLDDIHRFLMQAHAPVPLSRLGMVFHGRAAPFTRPGWLKRALQGDARFELRDEPRPGMESVSLVSPPDTVPPHEHTDATDGYVCCFYLTGTCRSSNCRFLHQDRPGVPCGFGGKCWKHWDRCLQKPPSRDLRPIEERQARPGPSPEVVNSIQTAVVEREPKPAETVDETKPKQEDAVVQRKNRSGDDAKRRSSSNLQDRRSLAPIRSSLTCVACMCSPAQRRPEGIHVTHRDLRWPASWGIFSKALSSCRYDARPGHVSSSS